MGKKKSVPSFEALRKKYIDGDSEVFDDDDEEIDEDEAFNSDDERKWGSFFDGSKSSTKKKKTFENDDSDSDDSSDSSINEDSDSESSGEEDDDGILSDDEDEGGDGGAYMLSLLDKLDSNEGKKSNTSSSNFSHHRNVEESEFSASVLKNENRGGELTVDQLMNNITDTKNFSSVQKQMKDMVTSDATLTPMARIHSERMKRKVHYEDQQKQIGSWMKVVQENRRSETLDFRPKERVDAVSKEELVAKFEPETEFEKEVNQALENLEKNKPTEADEFFSGEHGDDLGEDDAAFDQFQNRHSQLKKMRALMFYEEQKRHHINKIKSKKYRKIRRKQRERAAALAAENTEMDEETLREMQEKEELERMQERMTLAHRNTSKWAKRQLRRGKNLDIETRKALSAQIQKGDELKKKMKSLNGGDSSSESEAEYGPDATEDEILLHKAKKLYQSTIKEEKEEKKGLMSMAFMKRGFEMQKERAKQEAKALLEELEENMAFNGDNDESDDDGEEDGWGGKEEKSKKKKAKKNKNVGPVLSSESNKLVAPQLESGNTNSISVNSSINIDLNTDNSEKKEYKSSKVDVTHSEYETDVISSNIQEDDDNTPVTEAATIENRSHIVEEAKKDSSENPWLETATREGESKKSKKSKNTIMKSVQDTVSKMVQGSSEADKKKEDADSKEKKLLELNQEELVRKAFAAPSDAQVEDEFLKEKERQQEEEESNEKKKKTSDKNNNDGMVGWGSWVGQGMKPVGPPAKKRRNKKAIVEPTPQDNSNNKRKRKDDGLKHVIINEKRSKKNAKFQIGSIPYPFTSRAEYERAMKGSIGKEWNVSSAVKEMTRQDVITRAGKIIKPVSTKAKTQIKNRAPAKFY